MTRTANHNPVNRPPEELAPVVTLPEADNATPIFIPDATVKADRYIEVLKVYQGRRTNEKPIFPGVHDINGPELFGLGAYLVENGHAKPLSFIGQD